MKEMNTNGFGLWRVTTEGDCEGRTTKDLGIHEGFLDEIAFALAGSAMYGLRFSAVNTKGYLMYSAQTQVNVSLDIETRTWDMTKDQRVNYFKKMLVDRPIEVAKSDYCASVKLTSGRNPIERELIARELRYKQALSKLSEEDILVLGLERPKLFHSSFPSDSERPGYDRLYPGEF